MTDINEIRQWLQASRGERMPDGSSKWLVIAQKSKVSIRTLTNICSGTYDVPRQKTLQGLNRVRRNMESHKLKSLGDTERHLQKLAVEERKAARKLARKSGLLV